MIRGTIEKRGAGRVSIEFIDRGEILPNTFCSSFRIDGGPFIESQIEIKPDVREAVSVRMAHEHAEIHRAGGVPESIEFD